jgi:hypothetical protein
MLVATGMRTINLWFQKENKTQKKKRNGNHAHLTRLQEDPDTGRRLFVLRREQTRAVAVLLRGGKRRRRVSHGHGLARVPTKPPPLAFLSPRSQRPEKSKTHTGTRHRTTPLLLCCFPLPSPSGHPPAHLSLFITPPPAVVLTSVSISPAAAAAAAAAGVSSPLLFSSEALAARGPGRAAAARARLHPDPEVSEQPKLRCIPPLLFCWLALRSQPTPCAACCAASHLTRSAEINGGPATPACCPPPAPPPVISPCPLPRPSPGLYFCSPTSFLLVAACLGRSALARSCSFSLLLCACWLCAVCVSVEFTSFVLCSVQKAGGLSPP